MSKINDLIKELCPNGVKYQTVEDVCNFQNGYAFKSNLFKDDGDILLRITNIDGKQIDLSDIKFIDINDYNSDLSSFTVGDDEIVIAMSGATTGKIGINCTGKVLYLNQRVGKLTPKNRTLNNHFLYHYLLSKVNYFYELAGGGAQPNLSSESIKSTLLPLPPLEIQEEIVKILDKYCNLEAELEAELEARKSQYEFWRDQIFKFENRPDVKWLKLGDIKTEIYRGNGIKRDDVTEDGVPCVRYGEIYTTYNIWFDNCKSHTSESVVKNPKTFSSNDLLFAITGENIEDISKTIAYTGTETCYAGGDIVVMKHKQNGKYLSYALSTSDAIKQKGKGKVKSKVVHSSVPSIEEIVVPIVSLEEQEEIVRKLDDFYNLINSFDCGIPAEIELRRQQYEYYRNKLLSFEEI